MVNCSEPLDCTGCGAKCCVLGDGRCPYVSRDQRCLIYEDRPTVCREFDCRIVHVEGGKYMGCNCADRMRKYVLPEAGYHLVDGVWIDSDDGDTIPDSDVEDHHTRLTVKRNKLRRAVVRIAARKGHAKASALLDKLSRR